MLLHGELGVMSKATSLWSGDDGGRMHIVFEDWSCVSR